MTKPIDLTGQRFGKLVALKWTGRSNTSGRIWLCRCDCGKYSEVSIGRLKSGNTRQCKDCAMEIHKVACFKNHEKRRELRRDRLHNIWNNMRSRCNNPKHKSFQYYGGKGIKIYEPWSDSFEEFKSWAISNGYNEDSTIERVDINKDYCPQNCIFVSKREQAYNRTNTLYITFDDVKIPIPLIVYELGIDYSSFVYFLKNYTKFFHFLEKFYKKFD